MFGEKHEKRFEVLHQESNFSGGFRIIVDKETGVQYLFSWDGYAGGITPLLDKEGKPVIKLEDKF